MAANISSGFGRGLTRPGTGSEVAPKDLVNKAVKAQKVKSIKIKFKAGKGKKGE